MAAPELKSASPNADAYDRDFYRWTLEQARALRAGRFEQLDLHHLAEEVEDLGKEQFSKLESALRIILIHMLKWDLQPERRSRSWTISIERQRLEYVDVLGDNPGLKPRRDEAFSRAYRKARLEAAEETGLSKSRFPVANPYSLEDTLTRRIEWPDDQG